MNYDMTKPCDNCPFRRKGGIKLHESRVEEIATSDGEFPCHKTTVDDEGDDGESEQIATDKSAQCAGFLIFREKINRSSQMMRICERLRIYDASKFCESNPARGEVYDSLREMLAGNRPKKKRNIREVRK